MREASIDVGATSTSTATNANTNTNITARQQDARSIRDGEEQEGALELLRSRSGDACSTDLSYTNGYGTPTYAESEHGSTQFDGASADWSDTASYTSDTDGDDASSNGDRGGRRCARISNARPDAISGRAGSKTSRAENGRGTWPDLSNRNEGCAGDAAATASAACARRRRTRRGQGERTAAARGRGGDSSEDGYAEDIDSTSSVSDAGAGDDSDDSDGSDGSDGNGEDDSGEGDGDDPLEPIPGEVKLVPSMFPDRPPTVFFEYPKELGMARFNNVYFSEPLGARRLLFKSHWERNSVKNAFFRAGFSRTRSTMSWTASWGKHPTREGFRNLNRFQKVNHFPGSWCIGRKDRLMRTLARHKREITGAAAAAATAAAAAAAASGSTPKGGGGSGGGGGGGSGSGSMSAGCRSREGSYITNPVEITPDGFVLPADRRAWLKAVEAEPKAIWIVKPPASSCGRGIRVINKGSVGSVSKTKKGLVQRYIHNPMLIDGRKFDLRLYVLVTSMEPLRVYLFEEGLVRFSTKRYSLKNLRSRYTHLTNYSINKKSGSFQAPEDSDGQEAKESTTASKWALTFFWKYLEEKLGKGKSDEVQRSIEEVVLRTMVAADGDMTTHSHQFTRHRGCCYELFGFDVLLDEHLKPWLLEVNISPSLFGSSALDRRIKGTLMADIFHLVGFRPFDRMALRREERIEAKHIPGTRRAIRAVAGRPQDAWRRCQTPASINLAELGEEEWEVIRDTEDEQHRAGHFRILYPTAENVKRLWPIFRSPRFLNGVLARWVSTGGLSNPRNRQDIGLIAERLATLTEEAHHGKGKCSSSKSSVTGRLKGRGSGLDGRWEETTSNATTILSTGGRAGGRRLQLGELSGASQWLEGERPASSATSRASRPSVTRRPLWRATAATSTAATVASGAQSYQQQQQQQQASEGCTGGGTRGGGRRPAKLVGPGTRGAGSREGGGGGVASSGACNEKSSGVPRLHLRRVPSRVAVAPSLLTLQTPVVSARRFVGGTSTSGSSREGNSTATPRPRRVSSATSRPSSASVSRSSNRGNSVVTSLEVDRLNAGNLHAVGEKWGLNALAAYAPSDLAATAAAKKARDTPRRRSPTHQPEHCNEQGCTAPPSRNVASLPEQRADLGLRPCGTDAVSSEHVLPSSSAGRADLDCFPRPPCRAANHHTAKGAVSSDEDLFASGQLPYRYSGLTSSTKGMASRRSLSRASLRSRATTLADPSGLSGSRAIRTLGMSTHGAMSDVEPMSNEVVRGNAAATKEKLFPAATAVRDHYRNTLDGGCPRNRTGRKGRALEDQDLQFRGLSSLRSHEHHGIEGSFPSPTFKP